MSCSRFTSPLPVLDLGRDEYRSCSSSQGLTLRRGEAWNASFASDACWQEQAEMEGRGAASPSASHFGVAGEDGQCIDDRELAL